jgi:3-oxoacyl-[acyl-carrier protein] reductase|tara:strand:- start:221 stop:1009 length:789 start_codon:yes stop_codon:yes gene_type:complete
MQIDLKNKNALVCGSTQGIGKASALALAQCGANVTLVARDEQRLIQAKDELPNIDGQAHQFLIADFRNPEALAQAVQKQIDDSTAFHILVNNTGGPPGGDVFEASLVEFENAFTQHLKCNHLLAQAVVPGMKAAGFGRIINVISTSVKQPLDGLGVSNTIRGAVASWAKTLANELGPYGITVNNILPGATATERLSSIITNKSEKTGKSIDVISEAMKNSIPARRFAEPREVASAIAFLASDLASYINGINLPVDGGRTKSL